MELDIDIVTWTLESDEDVSGWCWWGC